MGAVLARAASMVGIIIMGYILKRWGFLDGSLFPVFSKLSIRIVLPCMIISKFSEFTMDRSYLLLLPVGILINLFTIAVGFLAGHRGGRDRQAYNMINYSGFNIGAFVLPFTQVFLGAEGVVALCLFDCGNSIMCTGGTYALASMVAGGGEKRGIGSFLKKLFSSIPMDVYLIMVILALLNIKLPLFIQTFAGIVGNANAFLAMLIIGLGFEWNLKSDDLKDTGVSLVFRYAVALVCALLFRAFLPFPTDVVKALMLAAFAPLSALTPVFTDWIGGDVGKSSALNSISLLISTMIITAILVLM